MMDTALKAEWFDLDDADRDHFLAWLYGEHLPALQAMPGHLWVGLYERAPANGSSTDPAAPPRVEVDDPDIPRGSQFVQVIAAASSDTFFDPHAPEFSVATKDRLATRKGTRLGIFIEETRVSGPDWYRHLPGSGAAPAIQFGNYGTPSQTEDVDLSYWYRFMKLPQVTRARGCIGARKLISIVGWAKHGILYEFMDMEDGEENFEPRFREVGLSERWQGRHVLKLTIHAPNGPLAGRRLWPPL